MFPALPTERLRSCTKNQHRWQRCPGECRVVRESYRYLGIQFKARRLCRQRCEGEDFMAPNGSGSTSYDTSRRAHTGRLTTFADTVAGPEIRYGVVDVWVRRTRLVPLGD